MKPLKLRLLGPMEILVDGTPLPTLPVPKGRWLLALLALREGTAVERSWLAETLWPDSFDLKARYNLRRCLTDLRDALGEQAARIESPSRETLGLDCEGVNVDVAEFDRFVSAATRPVSDPHGDATRTVPLLERAVALYRGPLLEGWTEEWVQEARVQRQEALLGALERLAFFASARADPSAACGYLRRAVALQPARESVRRGLLQALADTGDTAAVIQEYRSLRLYLRDTLAIEPTRETKTLFQRLSEAPEIPASAVTRPQTSAASLEMPRLLLPKEVIVGPPTLCPAGGALSPDSPLYIVRSVDETVGAAMRRGDGLLLIKGPHQIGKSSLLARAAGSARADGNRVVITDVAALGADARNSYAAFMNALMQSVAQQTGVEMPKMEAGVSPGNALERFLTRHALLLDKPNLVWVLDEMDVAFDAPFRDEMFALFRSWYNARALAPDAAWRRLTLILSYATEAHLLITDVNQSPFNVGTRVTLQDFTVAQTAVVNQRYGSPLTDEGVDRLWDLLRGHPFLTQRALAALAAHETDLAALERTAHQDDETLFSHHLRQMCAPLLRHSALGGAVVRVIARGEDGGDGTIDLDLFYRLRSAGILGGATLSEASCRCPLYETYLRRFLPLQMPRRRRSTDRT